MKMYKKIIIITCIILLSSFLSIRYLLLPAIGSYLEKIDAVVEQEGINAGKNLDEQGCLDSVLRKSISEFDFMARLKNAVFLEYCFQSSRPSSNFCDSVPSHEQFKEYLQWSVQQCAKWKTQGFHCDNASDLLSDITNHCHSPERQERISRGQ